MQETWVRSLGQEDPLEEEMATHSSIIAWKILWTEKPGGLQPIGSKRNQIWLSDQMTTRWFWCQLVFAKHLSTLQLNKFDPLSLFDIFSPVLPIAVSLVFEVTEDSSPRVHPQFPQSEAVALWGFPPGCLSILTGAAPLRLVCELLQTGQAFFNFPAPRSRLGLQYAVKKRCPLE